VKRRQGGPVQPIAGIWSHRPAWYRTAN
jgi:hypothetical protein